MQPRILQQKRSHPHHYRRSIRGPRLALQAVAIRDGIAETNGPRGLDRLPDSGEIEVVVQGRGTEF